MGIRKLWEAGTDVKVIAKWQGHNDGGKLIMNIYTEVFGSSSESYERQQMEKAARAFAGRGSNTGNMQAAAAWKPALRVTSVEPLRDNRYCTKFAGKAHSLPPLTSL